MWLFFVVLILLLLFSVLVFALSEQKAAEVERAISNISADSFEVECKLRVIEYEIMRYKFEIECQGKDQLRIIDKSLHIIDELIVGLRADLPMPHKEQLINEAELVYDYLLEEYSDTVLFLERHENAEERHEA